VTSSLISKLFNRLVNTGSSFASIKNTKSYWA